MRCPRCSGLVTPDLVACPSCGADLGKRPAGTAQGGSLLDRHRTQIEHDQASWRKQVFGSAGGSSPDLALSDAGRLDAGLQLDIPSFERAPAEDVTLEVEAFDVVNLLLLHAGFSPFRRLEVHSVGREGGLAGARLHISLQPELAKPLAVPLADIATGSVVDLPLLTPDYDRFFALDEAVRGQLDVEVRYEDTPIVSRSLPVTVQASNEWLNRASVEGALAGAVTSNAPAVVDLVASLEQDFSAYQDADVKRIVGEMAAVYNGIRKLDLYYLGVPPSFEGTGQKILFPDEVIASRRGCCIDIAVLTAAMLERIGYNPLIVLVPGHAFSGVWTSEMQAKRPVIHDAELMRQAVAAGDLVVWNSTTYFDRKGDDSIVAAVESGNRHLGGDVNYLLDIAACRKHGFKPVPRRSA